MATVLAATMPIMDYLALAGEFVCSLVDVGRSRSTRWINRQTWHVAFDRFII